MANRNYPQSRVFSNHVMPVSIDCQIAIGATGAPTIAAGNGYGVASITRMAAGQYRLQLTDNFAKLLQFKASVQSPVTGSGIAAGSLTPGLVYQIATMGTTTQAQWVTAGVPSGITAAVGVTFKCAATSAGTGTGKLLGTSGVNAVELLGSNSAMLNNSPAGGFQQNLGGYIDFQCIGSTITMGAYTPTGTISAGVIPVTAGTAGDAVTNNAGVLESTGGQDLTVGAQTFTGAAATLTATIARAAADPADGSQLFIEVVISNSSVQ